MPWSNDQFDGSITLPTGATSGQRIVLDGTSTPASITVYDASDNIVAQMTTDIPRFSGDDGGFYTLDPATGKIAALFGEALQFGDETIVAAVAPTITWERLTAFDPDVPRLKLYSGVVPSVGHQYSRLFLDSSTTGARAEMSASANTADVDDFLFTVYGDINVLRNADIAGTLDVTGNLTAKNIQVGSTSVPMVAVSSADVSVTFATAFDTAPKVTATLVGAPTLPAGSSALIVRAFNITTTGMTIRVNDVGAVARTLTATVNWHAIDG